MVSWGPTDKHKVKNYATTEEAEKAASKLIAEKDQKRVCRNC